MHTASGEPLGLVQVLSSSLIYGDCIGDDASGHEQPPDRFQSTRQAEGAPALQHESQCDSGRVVLR
jgi:hypothetical protein